MLFRIKSKKLGLRHLNFFPRSIGVNWRPLAVKIMQLRKDEYFYCDIELIRPNPWQPRVLFSAEEMEELCLSVKEQGIIQPLIVRQISGGYELVAGERRLRAAKMAGMEQVPVILKNVSDLNLLGMALVENIQRKDLNPMEEAEAYHRLTSEFGFTQEDIARYVGKSRPAVANALRLRNLPQEIRDSLKDGTLTTGHAKVLLSAENSARQREAWQTVIAKNLSVRETERLINRLKSEKKNIKKPGSDDIYFSNLADDLSRRLGTKVRIHRRGQKGKLEIEFYSNDDLDRLTDFLSEK